MANEIRQFSLVIPAGTDTATPAVLDVTFPPRNVVGIEVTVPPGNNGTVGWQIQNSGLPVIPYDSDEWIVASGEAISWTLDAYINSGSWQLAGYNNGTNDHTVYFRFLLNYLTTAAVAASPLLSTADLTPTGAL